MSVLQENMMRVRLLVPVGSSDSCNRIDDKVVVMDARPMVGDLMTF